MKFVPQKLEGWWKYGENYIILTSTVFDWSIRVTDGRTDRQKDRRTGDSIARCAYMLSRVTLVKNGSIYIKPTPKWLLAHYTHIVKFIAPAEMLCFCDVYPSVFHGHRIPFVHSILDRDRKLIFVGEVPLMLVISVVILRKGQTSRSLGTKM